MHPLDCQISLLSRFGRSTIDSSMVMSFNRWLAGKLSSNHQIGFISHNPAWNNNSSNLVQQSLHLFSNWHQNCKNPHQIHDRCAGTVFFYLSVMKCGRVCCWFSESFFIIYKCQSMWSLNIISNKNILTVISHCVHYLSSVKQGNYRFDSVCPSVHLRLRRPV